MRYSRRTSNYQERIMLFDLTHTMSMVDRVTIDMETLMIDSECSLKKEFIELIHMNPWMILYLTINHVDSYHSCIWGPST